MSTKSILDSIHGMIPLNHKILSIIDLPIFQRLKYIKQLSSVYDVYISATHTRREHSIGVSHIAKKYGDHLFSNFPSEDKDKIVLILQISGLYHDVSHGPISHAWDSSVYSKIYGVLDKGHDFHRIEILNQILKKPFESIGITCEDIENVWTNKNKLLSAIIHGPVGSDRCDFIKRDAYNIGTNHFGIIDIDRVIYNSKIYEKDGNQLMSYNIKIVEDIIQGMHSRLSMYLRVYLHKKVVAAGVIIEAMIAAAADILKYVERTQDLEKFMYLTDDFVLYEILSSTDPGLKTARIYANALYSRVLPKMVSEKKIEVKNVKYLPETNVEIISPAINDIKEFKCIWRSRILSNDFCKEFAKFDIHVHENGNHMPFSEYWKPDFVVSEYYIERVYSY